MSGTAAVVEGFGSVARGAVLNLDLLGPSLLGVAQFPERADRHAIHLGRTVIPLDDHSVPAADGQPARPLARHEVPVLDRELSPSRDLRLEMKRVTRMVLDHEAVAVGSDSERRSVHRNQEPLGIQGAGHLAVAGQPLGPLGARLRADEGAEVLRQGQLGQADLIIDLQPAGGQRRLDRSIHPLIGDVMGVRRGAAKPATARRTYTEKAEDARTCSARVSRPRRERDRRSPGGSEAGRPAVGRAAESGDPRRTAVGPLARSEDLATTSPRFRKVIAKPFLTANCPSQL